MGAGHDHHHRADRQQHQAALVQERRVLAGAPDQQDDPDQADHAEPVEDVARARHDLAGQRSARPDHRQRGAEQQPERPRVGSLVDPGVVEAGMEQHRHLDRRGGRQDQREHGQPRPHRDRPFAFVHHPQPEQQHPRPDQIELLLDRQRPQMAERRRWPEQREVRDVLVDLPPVVDVEERRQRLAAHVAHQRAVGDRDPDHDDGQHQVERRQQPPGAPDPEVVEAERALVPRAQQQVSDQIAAEREEHADAEQPPGGPADP